MINFDQNFLNLLNLLKSKEFELFNSLLDSQNYSETFKIWFENLCKDTHKLLSNCEKISEDLIFSPIHYTTENDDVVYDDILLPYDIVWQLQVANYFINGIMLCDINRIIFDEIADNLFESSITGHILTGFQLSSEQIESLKNLGFKIN